MRYQSRLIARDLEKRLRSNQTRAEKRLWSPLRKLSFKFRRQHRLRHFIVDFYCPEVRLALEVDGSVHSGEAAVQHDEERNAKFRSIGINVLHIRNEEVFRDLPGVLRMIEDVCLSL